VLGGGNLMDISKFMTTREFTLGPTRAQLIYKGYRAWLLSFCGHERDVFTKTVTTYQEGDNRLS